MFKKFGLLLAMALACSFSPAAVRRICKISYRTEDGWSNGVRAEVTFMTGNELNRATKTFEYLAWEKYALVWFAHDQVAILQFDMGPTIMASPSGFTADNFKWAFMVTGDQDLTQVNDEHGRNWKIVAQEFGSWIDARAF